MTTTIVVFAFLALVVIIVIAKTAIVVPQQNAFVVERLGKYQKSLSAGFHILLPFIDVIRYKHSLKERAVDIPEQICITRDNVQVGVDGVLYLKVMDPKRASYGVADYLFAISQLAQTTLRSEIGKIDLDRTFEERTHINVQVVNEVDKASDPWGIKVLRYEIKKHQSAGRRSRGDGKTDARRAREARSHPHLRRRARCRHQRRGRQQAAGHQGLRGHQAAADQRGRGRGCGDSCRRRSDRRRHHPGGRGDRRGRGSRSRPVAGGAGIT